MSSGDRAPFRRALGEAIRQARISAGLSQANLAVKVGLSRPAVASMESGRQSVLVEQLLAIATVVGVDFESLVQQALRQVSVQQFLPGLEDESKEINWIRALQAMTSAEDSPAKRVFMRGLRDGTEMDRGDGTDDDNDDDG